MKSNSGSNGLLPPKAALFVSKSQPLSENNLPRLCLSFTYATFLASSLYFTKASVGLPLRSVILLLGLMMLPIWFFSEFLHGMRQSRGPIAAMTGLALLGSAISLLNGQSIDLVAEYFSRFVLQPILITVFLVCIIPIIGQRFFGLVFVLLVCLSVFVALGQYAKVGIAWDLRAALSSFQDEQFAASKARIFVVQDRPLGLSLTTIHLSYQISLAYIVLRVLLLNRQIKRSTYFALALVLLTGAFASGNRSCLLGILVGEIIYAIATRDRTIFLALPAVVAGLAFAAVSDGESRTLSAADGSALGRIPLFILGLRLILDNPLGYGWGFDSRDYAYAYWNIIGTYDNAQNAELYGLHNYFLNFVVMYGLSIIPLAACWIALRPHRAMTWAILFLPYTINAALHNDGPLAGDNFFWFAFAICLIAVRNRTTEDVNPRRP